MNYKNHVNIYIHTNGFKSKILLLLVSRKTSLLFLILFNPNLKLSLKILYTKKKNKITHNNCQVELYPLLVPSSPSEIHILRPTTEQQREGKKEWRQVGESQWTKADATISGSTSASACLVAVSPRIVLSSVKTISNVSTTPKRYTPFQNPMPLPCFHFYY